MIDSNSSSNINYEQSSTSDAKYTPLDWNTADPICLAELMKNGFEVIILPYVVKED